MSEIENLFDEEILTVNLKAAAYFILLYEHFEDVVISTVKEFYSNFCMMDGIAYSDIDDEYIAALEAKINAGEVDTHIPYSIQLNDAKKGKEKYESELLGKKNSGNAIIKDGRKLRGSLIWLEEHDVLTNEQSDRIWLIRKRRNQIVHELFKVIGEGLTENDLIMIAELLSFSNKVNNWRFRQIEIPVMEIELPEGTTPEDVVNSGDMALSAMFRILFCGEGAAFKEALDKALETLSPNVKREDT